MTLCVLTVCVFDSLFKSRSKYFYDDDRVLVLTLISIEAIPAATFHIALNLFFVEYIDTILWRKDTDTVSYQG